MSFIRREEHACKPQHSQRLTAAANANARSPVSPTARLFVSLNHLAIQTPPLQAVCSKQRVIATSELETTQGWESGGDRGRV